MTSWVSTEVSEAVSQWSGHSKNKCMNLNLLGFSMCSQAIFDSRAKEGKYCLL